jgi:hypothetical protein
MKSKEVLNFLNISRVTLTKHIINLILKKMYHYNLKRHIL